MRAKLSFSFHWALVENTYDSPGGGAFRGEAFARTLPG
jgi:hypothetical protein